MDNQEVPVSNSTTSEAFRTNSKVENTVSKIEEPVEQKSNPKTESSSGGNVAKVIIETANVGLDDSKEKLMSATELLVRQFQSASVEQKQAVVYQFYTALDNVYEARYRDAPVPIIFSNSGGYAYNYDGFIRIPLDELTKQTSDKAVFSLLHEYRHAMQPSLKIRHSSMGLPSFSQLSHDLFIEEIDATKFAFEYMDSYGFDKTKVDRYGDWQKAIRITDTLDLLRQNWDNERNGMFF